MHEETPQECSYLEIFWHWQKLNQGSHWGWLQIKHTISKPEPTIIDLKKYGQPLLTYLPQNFLSKLFFLKKLRNTLPTYDLDIYVQIFVVFLDLSPYIV